MGARTGPRALWSMKQVETHADDLGLHLAHAGKHIRMKWVRDGKFGHRLIDNFGQFLPSLSLVSTASYFLS